MTRAPAEWAKMGLSRPVRMYAARTCRVTVASIPWGEVCLFRKRAPALCSSPEMTPQPPSSVSWASQRSFAPSR
jgi:hypothetical protein